MIDFGLLAAGVTVSLFVYKIIEIFIIDKIRAPKQSVLTKEEAELIKQIAHLPDKERIQRMYHLVEELHEWHSKVDMDGTPLWYVPRSWVSTQQKISDSCQRIAISQQEVGKTLERMTQILDKIVDKINA